MSVQSWYEPQLLRGTIPTGGSVSSSFNLEGYTLFSLFIPGTISGTAITFEVNDGQNSGANGTASWYPLYDSSAARIALTHGTVSSNLAFQLPLSLASSRIIRLTTSGTQVADRTLYIRAK